MDARCVTFVACCQRVCVCVDCYVMWRDVLPPIVELCVWVAFTLASTFLLLLRACKGRNNKYCIAFPVSVWLYFLGRWYFSIVLWNCSFKAFFFFFFSVFEKRVCKYWGVLFCAHGSELFFPPFHPEALYLFMHTQNIHIVEIPYSVRFLCIECLFNCTLIYFCLLNASKLSLPV